MLSRRKGLLPFARSELYREVGIVIVGCSEDQSPPPVPGSFATLAVGLLVTLLSSAHLATLVQKLHLAAGSGCAPGSAQRAVELALLACTELQELSIELQDGRLSTGWLEEAVPGSTKQLLRLQVDGRYEWSSRLFGGMLERHPFLRHLELGRLDGIDRFLLPVSLQLESFAVAQLLDADLLDRFIRRSRPSLKHLRLVGFGAG